MLKTDERRRELDSHSLVSCNNIHTFPTSVFAALLMLKISDI